MTSSTERLAPSDNIHSHNSKNDNNFTGDQNLSRDHGSNESITESQSDPEYLDPESYAEEEEEEEEEEVIPPFELAIQSVLGPALDTTVWRLRSLHESQVALTVQLNILTAVLESYGRASKPQQLKVPIAKINVCRQKLQAVNTTLALVEERLDRVKRRLLDEGNNASPVGSQILANTPPNPRQANLGVAETSGS
ncbi:uncharacterized protein SAPINGB_P005572 [Magnusiomyces paraingens]|uniref:Biogenesis of lysosome-related organelles complex 1 subunit 7 n=1 Tax=Magnusiomyces paraingens TaxID=2606893 RepID=A0A5E8C7I5_9ASCO|nr:uncharacterized protein SAPINGB_P005572 [Saprochaete ingens]VVT57176.1 unnamed protein product [Saprochaete ingens]